MPKKVKARKKGGKTGKGGPSKRELVFKEDQQEYAQVLKLVGCGELDAYCFDGVNRKCHIRGAMRKRVWIKKDDIILVSIREYQPDKADVIHKYQPDEARTLKSYGELPETANITAAFEANQTQEERPFEFAEEEEEIVKPVQKLPEPGEFQFSDGDSDLDIDDL